MQLMSQPYFEDFEVGQVFSTPKRTVTEADLVLFSAWSWDHHPLHTDEEFAKSSLFGTRVLHGQAGYVIASGLAMQTGLHRETALALLSVGWNYRAPIRIGDTLTVTESVSEKRESRSRPDRGIVIMQVSLINQNGDIVQDGPWSFMYARRPVAE